MSTIIRTEYVNVGGTPKVRAKGAGKQRTVRWDLARSTDWNHGTAAGALALALGLEWRDDLDHDQNESGTQHAFYWF